MPKDFADSFAAGREGAREVLAGLRTRAVDALDLALSEAPEESARKRFTYAKECVLPLLTKIEDAGEREAALEDSTEALRLKVPQVRHLRKTLAVMEEPEDKGRIEDEPTRPRASPSTRRRPRMTWRGSGGLATMC